jgi:DNA invertase Pin-like site-specific DNA recombinase
MRLIAYYRVSTDRQGQSGLGLEAQRERVEHFARSHSHQITGEYVEVQSGKDDSRPELRRALSQARLHGAGIIVAKLDRLARSAHFLETILASGVEVLFCDLPNIPPGPTGTFMVQMMASIAELEAGMISERTKVALAAAKQRGTKLGGFRGTAATPKARVASAEARGRRADATALRLMPVLEDLRQRGITDIPAIADALTEQQVPTPSGKATWTRQQVSRVIDRVLNIHQTDLEAAQSRATATAAWKGGTQGAAK